MTVSTIEKRSVTRARGSSRNQEVTCKYCGLYTMCVLAGLHDPESELLDRIVVRRRPVAKGELVFAEGHYATGICAVKWGAFKALCTVNGDQEQVATFYLPGELMGLDALRDGNHITSARALTPSGVCEFHVHHVDGLKDRGIKLQRELVRGLSGQLVQTHRGALLLRREGAEARLAAFLLDISSRYAEHGMPAQEFRIPMSRRDIANYLGLAVETVSRLFQRLQSQRFLVTRGRYTRLCNVKGLQDIARA